MGGFHFWILPEVWEVWEVNRTYFVRPIRYMNRTYFGPVGSSRCQGKFNMPSPRRNIGVADEVRGQYEEVSGVSSLTYSYCFYRYRAGTPFGPEQPPCEEQGGMAAVTRDGTVSTLVWWVVQHSVTPWFPHISFVVLGDGFLAQGVQVPNI